MGGPAMATTVLAVYEKGQLRPLHPLPLKEGQQVQVTIETEPAPQGLLGPLARNIPPEELHKFAMDVEVEYYEGEPEGP
jgi:predicted DNA-binding antitoxin AbrB/MazE fold protein